MMPKYHAAPGGDAVDLDLGPGLTGRKLSVGPMDNNAYLLTPDQGPAVLIDAAAEPERLFSLIGDAEVGTIVTTHRHHDHLGALAALARRTGARLVCGEPDAQAIAEQTGVVGRGVWDGDVVPVGEGHLEVVGLVGHTPGSIALAWRGAGGPAQLFTGDSLFPGGVGRVTSPADFESLVGDVEGKLFDAFPDDTAFHPGHGESSTLGAERPHLADWRERGW